MNTSLTRTPTRAGIARLAGLLVVMAFPALPANAAETLAGARTEVYKHVGDTDLVVYIFEPTGTPATNRPAIVFFFGGGWSGGTPTQFEQQCRHFAARGMVAFTADYRVKTRQGVKPVSCVADAKSSVRWIRSNAARLGIDPNRIAAAGGSAGGHIAAATGTLPEFDESGEDKTVSSVPNALLLFNPALVLAPMEGLQLEGFGTNLGAERLGAEPKALSPAHHVKAGAPPTIVFHGKADKTVPYSTAEAFAKEMKQAGNRCELVGYEGEGHGFFNFNRGTKYYGETLIAADRFLVSLGWLPPATVTPAVAPKPDATPGGKRGKRRQ